MADDSRRLMQSIAQHFTREMGFTLEEILRPLPRAVAPLLYRVQGRHISIEHPCGEIHIKLQQTTGRRVGALTIPLTPVEFISCGLNHDQRRLFMQRFDRHFQRGGG